jgi:arylsulfatase A-like enzyme
MPDHKVVTWATEKLDAEYDQPLFLAVGINKPHLPWYVPNKFYAMYPKNEIVPPATKKDDIADIPEIGRKKAAAEEGVHKLIIESQKWHDAVQAYLASISFADDQVGRLIEALDRSTNTGNTIIVLWSDHGWHLGEKMRWGKSTLWEESTRVPFIVVAPGVTKPGMLSYRPVDYMSIYPTLADLCGLPIPEHVQGASLRPLLKDPKSSWNQIALTTGGRGNHAVRNNRWRYIRYRDGTEELYDHTHDPMEWYNLAQFAEFSKLEESHDHTNGQIESYNKFQSAEISIIKEQMAQWIPVIETKNAPIKRNKKRE